MSSPTNTEMSIKVFISYAQEDQELRQKLEKHLSLLVHSGKILTWQDQEIPAGANWQDQIDTHLGEANIILLLVSASFIASKYYSSQEVETALSRHKAGTVQVIPIILKPVDWQDTPLGQLRALPTGVKPVTQWNDQDAALEDVARGIRKVVEDLLRTSQEEAQPGNPLQATRLMASPGSETGTSTSSNKEETPPQVPPRVDVDTSAQLKHRLVVPILILLSLVLIFAGSVGVYLIGQRIKPQEQTNILTPAKSNQAPNTPPATTPTNISSLSQVWHPQTSGTSQNLYDVEWSDSGFVVVGNSGTILTSRDGITWTSRPSGITQLPTLTSVKRSSSGFVIVGNSGTILTSRDGITCTLRPSGTTQKLFGVGRSGFEFVVVGDQGMILTSPDGTIWTPRSSGTPLPLWAVDWSGSVSVVVGVHGTILTSPDGIAWTSRTSGTSQVLHGVAWSGSEFVVVGDQGTILTSPDGIAWTPRTSGTSQFLTDVVWLGSRFVVVGNSGAILTSPDGITWTLQSSGTIENLFGVGGSDSKFVVVGDHGTILTSP